MPKWRVSKVVCETSSLDNVGIHFVQIGKVRLFEDQLLGKTPAYLRHLKRVGKPIVKHVSGFAGNNLDTTCLTADVQLSGARCLVFQ